MSSDPGYGPNGEYLGPVGAVTWQAQGPGTPVHAELTVWPLGLIPVPFFDQADTEAWAYNYLGGA